MTSSAETLDQGGAQAQHHDEHVLPLSVYFGVYGALLVLTVITVGVSMLDLGQLAIYVAMAVALVKAGLVVGYFMHLKFDARFNSLVFFGSVLFLAIFFVLTMIDLGSRDNVLDVSGNFVLKEGDQQKDRKAFIEASGAKQSPLHEAMAREENDKAKKEASAPAKGDTASAEQTGDKAKDTAATAPPKAEGDTATQP